MENETNHPYSSILKVAVEFLVLVVGLGVCAIFMQHKITHLLNTTMEQIVARQAEGNIYLLLWVDHHDEAYAWAKRKKCTVNRATGAIQVYETVKDEIAKQS